MGNWPYKTIIEPFKAKMVEPIVFTTRTQRLQILDDAGYNLFNIPADKVTIDFLTDSGTSAMSALQWSAMMRGDESYAGAKSFFVFKDVVGRLTGMEHVIPVHQGRAAERILFGVVGGKGKKIPGNTHFDTTRANIEASGAEAHDFPCSEADDLLSEYPFKGNFDLNKLEKFLNRYAADVPLCLATMTNNALGGQPISMANLRALRALLQRFEIPLFIDAARFAENAYFIKLREPGYQDKKIIDIVREMFTLAEGCLFSAKKDAFANIGGFLALNDSKWVESVRNELILTEGFITYGGLAGRDLEAIAQGLLEVIDEDYLIYRIRSTQYFGQGLLNAGVPVVQPIGGHAIYIDAGVFLPHIKPEQFPAHSLACEFYLEGGIRSCEMGSLTFGEHARRQLLRMAIPRRVYTQSHIDWVIELAGIIAEKKESLAGYRIVKAPKELRHFTARLEPLALTRV
ncbi:MAG: tryptophanase [Elusimicrobiota bacterium]